MNLMYYADSKESLTLKSEGSFLVIIGPFYFLPSSLYSAPGFKLI